MPADYDFGGMAHSRIAYGWLVAFVGFTAFGCTANVDATENASSEPNASETTALVVASRVSTVDGVRTEIAARFLRMQRGVVDDQALRMAGAEELPLPGCHVFSDSHSLPAGPARSLAMLDFGNVSVESAGTRTQLAPREVPDPVGLVSGVLYFARAQDGSALVPGERFTLSTDRAGDAPTVTALAPRELADLRIQNRDPSGEGVFSVQGDTLDLGWSPDDADSGDVIVFEFAGGTDRRVRCAVADDGAEILLLPTQLGDEVTLNAHRLRRASVQFPQGRTEVRVDVTRVYRITRR